MLQLISLLHTLKSMQHWHRYRYKNITLIIISVIITLFLLRNEDFSNALKTLGTFGYLGAFLTGIMFVSTFTVTIATIILFILAQHLHPIEIGIFAGIGAVVGDFIIFQSIRSRGLIEEIENIFKFFGGAKLHHLLNTRYFSWTLPVVGALLIATPFPDEIGVSLLGISQMKPAQFFLLSFVLNSIGIFLIVSASLLI